MKLSFYTRFVRPERQLERPDPVELVERAGYIPAKARVESMLAAGQRLVAFREGYEFGSEKEVPHGYHDPTRDPGFDLADASAARTRLAALAAERARHRNEERKAAEAAAARAAAPPEAPAAKEGGE